MAGFLKYEKQEQFVIDKQFLTLTFQSYKIYKIGDMVSFEEYHFSIVGVSMKYIDGMLQYTYTLRNKNGMNCRKQYNSKICGASIDGKIIKVQQDDVKLHLKIDAGQPVSEALFFKVAIDYTAEGSTGLYTAMDEGESVKLYFPSANEKDAYVRCVDKNDRETNEYFTKPTTQCYGTPYGSCMRTKEDEILISAVQDEMYIRMDEEDGIEIHSFENIDIYSEKDITINCKQLKIQSEEKILLQTEEDLIIVDETIYMDCNL